MLIRRHGRRRRCRTAGGWRGRNDSARITKPLAGPVHGEFVNPSATIAADDRRFCHQINPDEVFGTHRKTWFEGRRLTPPTDMGTPLVVRILPFLPIAADARDETFHTRCPLNRAPRPTPTHRPPKKILPEASGPAILTLDNRRTFLPNRPFQFFDHTGTTLHPAGKSAFAEPN